MNEIKLKWLMIGELLSSIGMSFIWPLTSVYLHNRLNVSLSIIGIVLLFNSLASVLGSYLAGYLYDRQNPYHLIIGGISGATMTLLGLTFFHGWPIFGFWLFANGFTSGWNLTLVNSIGTSITTVDSRYVFNMLYFSQNLGVVIGTSLVGFIYNISITLLFSIAAGLFLLLLLVAVINYRPAAEIHRQRSSHHYQSMQHRHPLPTSNKLILIAFFISLLIIWTMYQQWVSNLSVYMTTLGIPLKNYSFLWTINAGLIVVIQLMINWLAHYHQHLIIQILFGISMIALSFGVLILAKSYGYFIISMIILTIGEATTFPAIPALVNALTPAQTKGRYQGLLNAWSSTGRALGPLFGGIMIEWHSYTFLFLTAALTILIVWLGIGLLWWSISHRLTIYHSA